MTSSQGFQRQVNVQPAPGVEGDFCDRNPRYIVDAGPGGLIAGASGLIVGRFAWATYPPDADGSPAVVNNSGGGPVTGFVHRDQQGLIVNFLTEAAMTMQAGFPVTLFSGGGFWAKNVGLTEARNGMKAFASTLDGTVSFAAAGTIPGGASGATSAVVQTTLTLVGGIADNILTVASVSAGAVYNGSILSSNAVGTVVKQLTGTAHGAGTYLLDTGEQSVAAGTTIGGTYGVITYGTVTGGPFAVGMTLTGTGVVAGTVITESITGGGTSGTQVVNPSDNVSSATIVGSTLIETKWYARSTGLTGEIVKISDQALG